MPRVRETPEAFIVEPTGAEQWGGMLSQMLPQMLLSIRQLMQQQQEQKDKTLAFRARYHELAPEIQATIAADPELAALYHGRKIPKPVQGLTKRYAPVRDLTQEELLARTKAKQDIELGKQNITRNEQLIEEGKASALKSKAKMAAYGKIENVPPEQLELWDFITAFPEEDIGENSKRYLAKKYPKDADRLAQVTAGFGPEVERVRTSEAFMQCTERFGKADKDCFAYADAIGTNNLEKLKGVTNLGMKTLAFKNYEMNVEQNAQAARRANQMHQESIGAATQRIIDDDPRIPLPAARKIAESLMEGTPLPKELLQYEVNRVALKQEITRMNVAKLQIELEEQSSGIKGLQSIVDLHLKILGQQEGVPGDVKNLSTEQLRKLMPELVLRVGKHLGLKEPAKGEEPAGMWGTIGSFVSATMGLGAQLGGNFFKWERDAAGNLLEGVSESFAGLERGAQDRRAANYKKGSTQVDAQHIKDIPVLLGSDAITLFQSLGKTISSALQTSLMAVDNVRKATEGAGLTSEDLKLPEVAGTKPKVKALDPDQQVHIQNLAGEIVEQLRDRSLPLPVVQKLEQVLTMIEEVHKGKRSFQELVNARIN